MKNKKILIAGATGYLGSHILHELKQQQYFVRALVRSPEKLKPNGADEIFKGQITVPSTIQNCCSGTDTVISTVGITRQRDNLTYMDVDYQGNLNLLHEALQSGVKRFIYVFIYNADKMKNLKIIRAKQQFVDALKNSGINYCLINPTGFFSDMREFLTMAQNGKAYLFGKGDCRINPIDGRDLAKICVEAVNSGLHEVNAGGPQILSYRQIAEMAFQTLDKKAKIFCIPIWMKSAILFLLRKFTSVKLYGPVEFLLTVLTTNMVAQQSGTYTLQDYFETVKTDADNSTKKI